MAALYPLAFKRNAGTARPRVPGDPEIYWCVRTLRCPKLLGWLGTRLDDGLELSGDG